MKEMSRLAWSKWLSLLLRMLINKTFSNTSSARMTRAGIRRNLETPSSPLARPRPKPRRKHPAFRALANHPDAPSAEDNAPLENDYFNARKRKEWAAQVKSMAAQVSPLASAVASESARRLSLTPTQHSRGGAMYRFRTVVTSDSQLPTSTAQPSAAPPSVVAGPTQKTPAQAAPPAQTLLAAGNVPRTTAPTRQTSSRTAAPAQNPLARDIAPSVAAPAQNTPPNTNSSSITNMSNHTGTLGDLLHRQLTGDYANYMVNNELHMSEGQRRALEQYIREMGYRRLSDMTCLVFRTACQEIIASGREDPPETEEDENEEDEEAEDEEEEEDKEEEDESEVDRGFDHNNFRKGPRFDDDDDEDGGALQERLKVSDMGKRLRGYARQAKPMPPVEEDVFSSAPSASLSILSQQLRDMGAEITPTESEVTGSNYSEKATDSEQEDEDEEGDEDVRGQGATARKQKPKRGRPCREVTEMALSEGERHANNIDAIALYFDMDPSQVKQLANPKEARDVGNLWNFFQTWRKLVDPPNEEESSMCFLFLLVF